MVKPHKILVLGGTAKARQIAEDLNAAGYAVIYSLAGLTQTPKIPNVETRVGGFGGVSGLQSYISSNQIDAIVDATHPFAVGISQNADLIETVPVLRVDHPAWKPTSSDMWQSVKSLDAAVRHLATMTPKAIFLALGAKHVGELYGLSQHRLIVRLVEMPDMDIPENIKIIQQRPPFDIKSEIELFQTEQIHMLVTRNAGSDASWPKVAAARALGLPVVMIEQPDTTASQKYPAAQILDHLSHLLAS